MSENLKNPQAAKSARRRPCESHMGHTPVLSRLTAGISPARHNVEYLSATGGQTPKIQSAGGRDFNRRVVGRFTTPTAGNLYSAWRMEGSGEEIRHAAKMQSCRCDTMN